MVSTSSTTEASTTEASTTEACSTSNHRTFQQTRSEEDR